MKKISRTLLVLLLTALPAAAEFEGVMDMKMTMTDADGNSTGGGNLKVAVGKPGVRSEVVMQMSQMSVKMVMLFQNDNPDVIYRIDDHAKSYTEIKTPKDPQPVENAQDADKYTVKKLGEEKIVGYNAQHVLVMHKTGTNEMWVAKDFLPYDTFKRLQARQGSSGNAGMEKALKDAGAEGMPLKAIMAGPMGGKMTMEVVKADKQSLPASTFQIPAGYTKSAGGMMDALGGVQSPQLDEARKQMQDRLKDAMKNMTPEQRRLIEERMKQQGVQQ